MPNETLVKKKVLSQDPAHAQHLRLPGEIELLKKHIKYFRDLGDNVEADKYEEKLKHSQDGLVHASRAATLVDQLELSHEITPTTITYNDALRFVAKTLHETQHGTKTSNYTRANHSSVNDGAHIDLEKHNAPRDEATEVIEHLGLTEPAHIAAVNTFFGKAV